MDEYGRVFVRRPDESPAFLAADGVHELDTPAEEEWWTVTVKVQPPGAEEYLWNQVAISPRVLEECVGGNIPWDVVLEKLVKQMAAALKAKFERGEM